MNVTQFDKAIGVLRREIVTVIEENEQLRQANRELMREIRTARAKSKARNVVSEAGEIDEIGNDLSLAIRRLREQNKRLSTVPR